MPAVRAWLIWNPVAGRRPERRRTQVENLAAGLRHGGWSVELAETIAGAGAGPAAEHALAGGCEVLVGCGGDGTLREIAQAVYMRPPPHPTLGVVALGTANVLAHALGCVVPVEHAAHWLLDAQPRERPLGVATRGEDRRFFLSVASAGLDAEVVHRMTPAFKRRWGKLAYAGSAMAQAGRYFPAPIAYDCGGHCGSADGIILGLSRYYGGRLKLGRVEEGASILLALRGAPWWLPGQALALATVGLERGPRVERLTNAPIRLMTAERPLELDGEPAGTTPVNLDVVRGGARMLMR